MCNFRKRKVMKSGFTLIELLIVIAIVAILAGAMVPMFRTTAETARVSKAMADLDVIKTASMNLHLDTGRWPPTGPFGNDLVSNTNNLAGWNGPYLDEWKDDPWTQRPKKYDIYDLSNDPLRRYVKSYGAQQVGFETSDPSLDCQVPTPGCDDVILLITPDNTN